MALPVTPQDVRDLSLTGEFNAFTDPQIQPRITRAECMINVDIWNVGCADRAELGIKNLAAHWMVVEQDGGNASGGEVLSEAGAGLSHSFAGSTDEASEKLFSGTAYGQAYLAMKRVVPVGGVTACSVGKNLVVCG